MSLLAAMKGRAAPRAFQPASSATARCRRALTVRASADDAFASYKA
jgi:hypothetical protein